jgi:hypothetical protein
MALNMMRMKRLMGSMRTYFTYSNQISQPLERVPPMVSAKEAVSCIKSGKDESIISLESLRNIHYNEI